MKKITADFKKSLDLKDISKLLDGFREVFSLNNKKAKFRNSTFNLYVTFRLFLFQVLYSNISCKETIKLGIVKEVFKNGDIPSLNDSAYCQARGRMPTAILKSIFSETVENIKTKTGEDNLWFGKHVKVIDGSTLSMPDTAENQKRFPQPANQKKDCGFPMTRMFGVFDLRNGALIRAEHDSLKIGEKTLFIKTFGEFKEGDVVLGDRGFSAYAYIWYLKSIRKADVVMRMNEKSVKRFSTTEILGKGDTIISLKKPETIYVEWLDKEEYKSMPKSLTLRRIESDVSVNGYRTKNIVILTTFLSPDEYPKEEIIKLYLRRWFVELFLRDLKTTMNMDKLKCRTPEMIEKEILMFTIAYNIIRIMMYKGSTQYMVKFDRISFKGALDTVKYMIPDLLIKYEKAKDETECALNKMLILITSDTNRKRDRPSEPRAIKGRLKPYDKLNINRHIFKERYHGGKKKCIS